VNILLSANSDLPYYSLKTDSLDRFGTRLEQRFTLAQIKAMFTEAGLINISYSNYVTFWCVIGYKDK